MALPKTIKTDEFKYTNGKLLILKKNEWLEATGTIKAEKRRYLYYSNIKKGSHDRGLVHRKIWSMFNGPIPKGMFIDHINNDPMDNRIENLRLVTPQQNNLNRNNTVYNKHGFRGISTCGKRWRAYIVLNRKQYHLGVFATKLEAVLARKEGEIKYGYQ